VEYAADSIITHIINVSIKCYKNITIINIGID